LNKAQLCGRQAVTWCSTVERLRISSTTRRIGLTTPRQGLVGMRVASPLRQLPCFLHGIKSVELRRRTGPQRVLVVDDSEDLRELWRQWLGFHGFRVEEASNGLEGVRQVLEQPPDIVLMDIRMPLMDGLEATRRLQADNKTARVPIVALSAESGARAAARASGCVSFLQKTRRSR
jgi:two-component system cell cycle response regulator DivK